MNVVRRYIRNYLMGFTSWDMAHCDVCVYINRCAWLHFYAYMTCDGYMGVRGVRKYYYMINLPCFSSEEKLDVFCLQQLVFLSTLSCYNQV